MFYYGNVYKKKVDAEILHTSSWPPLENEFSSAVTPNKNNGRLPHASQKAFFLGSTFSGRYSCKDAYLHMDAKQWAIQQRCFATAYEYTLCMLIKGCIGSLPVHSLCFKLYKNKQMISELRYGTEYWVLIV